MNAETQAAAGKTLAAIAGHLQARLIGDGSLIVNRVSAPLAAQSPHDLALAMQPQPFDQLAQSAARCAVISEGTEIPQDLQLDAYLVVRRPRYALAMLLQLFDKPPRLAAGIHPSAVIEASAKIDASASIGALCYIGEDCIIGANVRILPQVTVAAGSVIGDDCLLHSGVRIGEDSIIGQRVIIQANACLGADGFSYATPEPGSVETAQAGKTVAATNTGIKRINSIGQVVIEDDVEIGACTTIDRATVGQTIIARGTKIDNLVMVAHNNSIGEDCLIAGQTGIAGSCQIGDRVVMAGQVGIADHIRVGNDAVLAAGAGIANNVPKKAVMILSPAIPYPEFTARYKALGRLKRLFKDLAGLKERVLKLEQNT